MWHLGALYLFMFLTLWVWLLCSSLIWISNASSYLSTLLLSQEDGKWLLVPSTNSSLLWSINIIVASVQSTVELPVIRRPLGNVVTVRMENWATVMKNVEEGLVIITVDHYSQMRSISRSIIILFLLQWRVLLQSGQCVQWSVLNTSSLHWWDTRVIRAWTGKILVVLQLIYLSLSLWTVMHVLPLNEIEFSVFSQTEWWGWLIRRSC